MAHTLIDLEMATLKSLRIRLYVLRSSGIAPKNPIVGMGFLDHQSYSREVFGCLGISHLGHLEGVPQPDP